MNINIYLIIIAHEDNQLYVMLEDGEIPERQLKDFNSSFLAVENMMNTSMNITGRWNEFVPKLIGTLDDISRVKDSNRLVTLVYSFCIPVRNKLNNKYNWFNFFDLEQSSFSDETKSIVRYAAINTFT